MKYIQNPIISGFNPDPSIVRVKDNYYIAVSTFQWFPGVLIYHSGNLIYWELVARPLNRISQLDMKGNLATGGIWAPSLTYDDGLFYLVYTDMKNHKGIWKDCHNYLVTSESIFEEWSDPIYLNSSGFDPSLFHDQDGRKWLVNMLWDHRQEKNSFSGIVLQEYSLVEKKLVGPIKKIFDPEGLSNCEGPNLYKKNGYYYLIMAQGGTDYAHSAILYRSRNIEGPYQAHPQNPILTSRNNPDCRLQKAGHADIVETQTGDWYITHLCGRPLPGTRRCTLGRETGIQKVIWKEDNWLYLDKSNSIVQDKGTEKGYYNNPELKIIAPDLPVQEKKHETIKDDFNNEEMDLNWQTLRMSLGEDTLSLKERPGFLRLKGKESLSSEFKQSLIARRWKHFQFTATTCLEFEPDTFQQMAGLVCYYNKHNFIYLHLSHDEVKGKVLRIIQCTQDKFSEPLSDLSGDVPIGSERCYLRVNVNYDYLQFYYSLDEKEWIKIGSVFDASLLADECTWPHSFTGTMIGLCCQDLSGQSKHADFDWFEYKNR